MIMIGVMCANLKESDSQVGNTCQTRQVKSFYQCNHPSVFIPLLETLLLINALVRNNFVMFVRGKSHKVKFASGFYGLNGLN